MRDWLRRFNNQISQTRTGIVHGIAGAPMSVGGGEIPNGRAPDKIVNELSVLDHRNPLRFDSFIVSLVVAKQSLVVDRSHGWIVHDRNKVREHAGLEVGRPIALGPSGLPQVRFESKYVVADHVGKNAGRGIGRK